MNPLLISGGVGLFSGILIGGTIIHWKEQVEYLSLVNQIEIQKTEAASLLLAKTNTEYKRQEQQRIQNKELEKSHEQNIATINSLHERISSIKLREPSRKSCGNAEATSNNTGNIIDEAQIYKFAAGLHQFIGEKSMDSGKVDLYAQECYSFVVERNCGIEK